MLLLELSRAQKCCFYIPILFCFYFSFLKIFPLEIQSWAKMLTLLVSLSHQDQEKEADPPHHNSPSTVKDKVLIDSCICILIMVDLPNDTFSLSGMTQSQEPPYMLFKQASNTMALETLKITFDEFG